MILHDLTATCYSRLAFVGCCSMRPGCKRDAEHKGLLALSLPLQKLRRNPSCGVETNQLLTGCMSGGSLDLEATLEAMSQLYKTGARLQDASGVMGGGRRILRCPSNAGAPALVGAASLFLAQDAQAAKALLGLIPNGCTLAWANRLLCHVPTLWNTSPHCGHDDLQHSIAWFSLHGRPRTGDPSQATNSRVHHGRRH